MEAEPALKLAEEDSITDASDNKRPPPLPRFDLRAALAKCKPRGASWPAWSQG